MDPTPLPDPPGTSTPESELWPEPDDWGDADDGALEPEELPAYDPDLVLDTDDAICRTVHDLIGLEDRRWPALWFLLLSADAHPWPVLLPVEGLPAVPTTSELDGVLAAAAAMLEEFAPGGALVLTLVHPRGGHPEQLDRHWSGELRRAAERSGVPLRAVLSAGRRGTLLLSPGGAAAA